MQEWNEDSKRSLWDPYSYIMEDRNERRQRLGVALQHQQIKSIEEIPSTFIPSVRKDDQLLRYVSTNKGKMEKVGVHALVELIWQRTHLLLPRMM